MLKRYQIISNCLSAVQKADISTIDRLQLEVALYRLKMVLLTEEEAVVRGSVKEQDFANLIKMISDICSQERAGLEVQKCVIHLNEVKERILKRTCGDCRSSADGTAR